MLFHMPLKYNDTAGLHAAEEEQDTTTVEEERYPALVYIQQDERRNHATAQYRKGKPRPFT